ncbi:fibroblast growth factor receptor-like 1 [Trichonephila clavata]|uniref:receptor protein-tyrosine kinase n=1 Tax=Trichonephila clavata TaxID=2740835 RepID=A0A8X6GDI2_TRICU|nr:fibroblast growth factor receptor-like 1 [Trichonephila clavata]
MEPAEQGHIDSLEDLIMPQYWINVLQSSKDAIRLRDLNDRIISLLTLNSTRPDLSVFHPLNTTVKYGSSATFQCRVRSEAPPNIQWLKKVEDYELPKLQKQHHDIIKVQGENYRVLQSSEVVERSDGSFLNKLTIPEVFEADSGKYICLGAHSMGYSFRSAYLTVLPSWSRSVAVHPGYPGSLLVAIPITLGVVVGVMVALVVLCHRRRLDNSVPFPAAGYRKEDQKRASRTATTAFDNFKDDSIDNGLYSVMKRRISKMSKLSCRECNRK